jgi:hypothetical protein
MFQRSRFACAVLVLLVIAQLPPTVVARRLSPQDSLAQPSVESPASAQGALEPGAGVTRDLPWGATHEYRLDLVAGQFVRIVLDQRGVDVALRLLEPSGEQTVTTDGIFAPYGPELLCYVARTTGAYRLEVMSATKGERTGQYDVLLQERRAGVAEDMTRLAAQAAWAAGVSRNSASPPPSGSRPATRSSRRTRSTASGRTSG